MRCKGPGCRKCRKNKLDKARCWRDWNLCGTCAVKFHPDQYHNKIVQSYKIPHQYNKIQYKESKLRGLRLELV